VCVDHTGKLFASALPCGSTMPLAQDQRE
jgi:hypothetical protein